MFFLPANATTQMVYLSNRFKFGHSENKRLHKCYQQILFRSKSLKATLCLKSTVVPLWEQEDLDPVRFRAPSSIRRSARLSICPLKFCSGLHSSWVAKQSRSLGDILAKIGGTNFHSFYSNQPHLPMASYVSSHSPLSISRTERHCLRDMIMQCVTGSFQYWNMVNKALVVPSRQRWSAMLTSLQYVKNRCICWMCRRCLSQDERTKASCRQTRCTMQTINQIVQKLVRRT